MFYVKLKLPGGKTVTTEITDENVFTKCPECMQEIPVDLGEILSDGESDLLFTQIVCSNCTAKKVIAGKDCDGAKMPITFDGIVWLENILTRTGYVEEIDELYDQFFIDSLDELSPEEYNDFGNAMAKIAIEAMEE